MFRRLTARKARQDRLLADEGVVGGECVPAIDASVGADVGVCASDRVAVMSPLARRCPEEVALSRDRKGETLALGPEPRVRRSRLFVRTR